MRGRHFISLIAILVFFLPAFGQTELITNAEVIEMVRAGLGTGVIIAKISNSSGAFDVSVKALVEMKKAGVSDEIIGVLMEKGKAVRSGGGTSGDPKFYSEAVPAVDSNFSPPAMPTSKQALLSAKTLAFEKSSLQPSRQALEKELLKRGDWKQLNLTIVRYKDAADLYGEIGFVSGSWITHRYVYRIYDRRSGAVIAAGETTSWGSLAENLARHISKNLSAIAGNPSK